MKNRRLKRSIRYAGSALSRLVRGCLVVVVSIMFLCSAKTMKAGCNPDPDHIYELGVSIDALDSSTVCVGDEVTFHVTVSGGPNTPTPVDTYDWSHDPYSLPSESTGDGSATYKAKWDTPGEKGVIVWVNGGDDDESTPSTSWCYGTDEVYVTVVGVDFDKDPVKVGIGATRTSETATYPTTSPATYPYRLTATITPKEAAGVVTFGSSNEARATVTEESRTDVGDTKQVVLKVTGVAKTPAESPGGDADIHALLNGVVCKTTKVIVLIPAAIHSPHPEFDGTVVGQNYVLDSTTTPAVPAGAGNVVLASGGYFTSLTVTVDDQFGATLNAIYGGAPVSEAGIAINEDMTSSGTFSDVVGNGVSASVVPAEDPLGTPNPAIATFLASPVPAAPDATLTQSFSVEIDGHSLNPAIVNRKVTTSSPNNLKIEWP